MFLNRKKELETLRKFKSKNDFQMIIIYGRRRVGKTTLIKEFSKEMDSIFFICDEVNDKILLDNFSDIIMEHFGLKDTFSQFESWEKALRFLSKKAAQKQLLLVIDEFPYLANAYPAFSSILQRLIDQDFLNSKLFIILCGSSISFMEKKVLSAKSPLFGRRTGQMKIEQFDYMQAANFFPDISLREKVSLYGIMGGIPQYILKWNKNHSIEENIKDNFLNTSSYLYAEPKFLLKQELREPSLYNSIVESIAHGATKLNEISTKIGQRSDKTSKYISILIELEILEKIQPVTEKINSKKTFYSIKDELFRFWYTFVFPETSLIETGYSEFLMEKKIIPELNSYLGKTFEKICTQYLIKKNAQGKLPEIFDKIGKWWGNNPILKREEEIDILCINDHSALFAECKWRNKKTGVKEYNDLTKKSELIKSGKKYFYLFSKTGFTENLEKLSGEVNNLKLIDLIDLYENN